MRRWLACVSALVATIWSPARADAQFYQARPLPPPAAPTVNHIGVPGQQLPQVEVKQFGPLPASIAPMPQGLPAGRQATVRPQVVTQPYWFIPWRLRRR